MGLNARPAHQQIHKHTEMTRSPGKLTREQHAAITVFINNRERMQQLLQTSPYFAKQHPLPETNFINASYFPYQIAQLPRGNCWCWNQSNAKTTVRIDEATVVTLRKISPRSRSCGNGNVPSCKMWVYHVESNMQEYHFMWCEKGFEVPVHSECWNESGIVTEIGIIFPERISVESLSFLMPFVNETLAGELGWL